MRGSLPIIILFLSCALLGSCSLKTGFETSPQIYAGYFICNEHSPLTRDTLQIISSGYVVTVDSVNKGDTVSVLISAAGISNPLRSIQVNWDKQGLILEIEDTTKLYEGLLPSSSCLNGTLNFQEDVYGCTFKMHYIPKISYSQQIDITVSSDSKYSPIKASVIQNVR